MSIFYTKRAVKAAIFRLTGAVFFLFSFVLPAVAQPQLVPELVFNNAVRISGSAGANGAVYRFQGVTEGVDALVTIVGRKNNNVQLSSIDINTTGYDNAFQPVIKYINAESVGAHILTDWYMEFKIAFVQSADNSIPAIVKSFNATALDVDGTSSGSGSGLKYLHERYGFYGLTNYTTESNTTLSISDILDGSTVIGKYFEAGDTEYDGIDVDASRARVTCKYENMTANSFNVRIGGSAKGSINMENNGRQYSIWFKSFTYINPSEGPLPVDILSFTAKLNKNAAVLDWTTANEKDFSHFTIQRSTDGSSFTDIGTVAGKQSSGSANTSYTFTDAAAVQSTIVYYRLKMVDIDGTYKYSDIKLVRRSADLNQGSVVLFPNPVVNELRVTIPDSWQSKKVAYTIYNSNGNAVAQRVINSAGQTEIFNLSGIASGLYTVRVIKDSETIVKQFVKN